MKYNIKIGKETYSVDIENINVRPVIAYVDGERFEVTPEREGKETRDSMCKAESRTFHQGSRKPALSGNAMTAPLPGTVVEVFVKAGEKVEAGQVVLIIEAMKMKNSIRSVYSGTISEVLVVSGQSVAFKQPLIKFTDVGEASWM
jgi:biotin carboxyl carrier protein